MKESYTTVVGGRKVTKLKIVKKIEGLGVRQKLKDKFKRERTKVKTVETWNTKS